MGKEVEEMQETQCAIAYAIEQERVINILKEISKNMPTRWPEYYKVNHFKYNLVTTNDDMIHTKI